MSRAPFQSVLNYVALPLPNSSVWLVGHQVPGTNQVVIESDGFTEQSAKDEARRLNFPRSQTVRRDWKPEKAVYA